MFNFEKPAVNAPTAQGQIEQLRSYLYRLTDDLEMLLNQNNSELHQKITELEAKIKRGG